MRRSPAAVLRTCLAAAIVAIFMVAPNVVRAADADEGRFALLVGANLGERGDPVLHHAEQDATRLAETLRLLGRFPADQLVLMTSPTASELRDALIKLNARVREHKDAVLLVFYSGHADEQALHLGDTRLPMAELKALLVGSPARTRLLLVDACRSGSLIQLKGGRPVAAFPIVTPQEPVPEGFAVLTSSAASEDSQESGALSSSYFTYYLNAGLMGAADQNRDSTVTLAELYAFASSETRIATANSLAGPQNPTFQFALGGRHDLVLTRLGLTDERLGALRFAQAGRYVVQRRTLTGWSPPVAEVSAHESGAELALAPGTYRVVLRGERDVSQQDFAVSGGAATTVELRQLVRLDLGRIVRKGGARPSATGLGVLAGWHSASVGSSSVDLGSGFAGTVSLRHDRRRFSLELRLGFDRASIDRRDLTYATWAFAPAFAALHAFDFSALTVTLGASAGPVLVREEVSVGQDNARAFSLPANPALLGTRWVGGWQFGPLAQLDVPLGTYGYLRVEGGFDWRVFSRTSSGSLQHDERARLLLGFCTAF